MLHADKPLRRRTEDDRCLVAPAMRIAVLNFLQVQQVTASLDRFDHHVIGLPYKQAANQRRTGGELAIVGDRAVIRQFVFLPDEIVIQTVRWSGVYQAGTGFCGNVSTADDGHETIVKGML